VDEVLGQGPLEPQHLEKLVYTRAVIDEAAIRLYPPAPYMSRTAINDDRIGEVEIPADSMLAIAPYVLHRHKRLWDEPDVFRPERFLPENRGRIDRFAYLPFGAGPRVCIGASFSLQEAVIVLATIARTVRLDLVEGHEVTPVQRITLRPRGGLPMRLTQRVPQKAPATA
jgi:cytochrome P450